MNTPKRLDKIFKDAERIHLDPGTKIVLMSDIHRSDGSASDDFVKNQNLYFSALTHYFDNGYFYIELGDGDELWKNKTMEFITAEHSHVFWLLREFYNSGRLRFIYGNHDIVKRSDKWLKKNYYTCCDERENCNIPLFQGVHIPEGLVLKNGGHETLLVHGHQADFLNSTLWKLSRFLVRHVWRPMELLGIKDPFSVPKSRKKRDKIERALSDWATKSGHPLIAGHTHRPVFPKPGEPPYYNDGSAVHPRCVTAIELNGDTITLVKWSVKTRPDGVLYIGKDILERGVL